MSQPLHKSRTADGYATPFTTGVAYILAGLILIVSALVRPFHWLVGRLQERLVRVWISPKPITRDDAVAAWLFTLYSVVIVIVLTRFLFALLS